MPPLARVGPTELRMSLGFEDFPCASRSFDSLLDKESGLFASVSQISIICCKILIKMGKMALVAKGNIDTISKNIANLW